MRILRIENDVDGAGAVVKIENFFPRLAAVARAEDSAFGVRAVSMAESGHKNDVRIRGMNNDRADMASVFQAHVDPALARVRGFVNAVTKGNIAANAGFAGANVNDVGIGIRNRDGADGRDRLLIEQWIPSDTAVGGFPDASADGSEIIGVWLARHARHRQHAATTKRTDKPPLHAVVSFGINLLRIGGRTNGNKNQNTHNCG